MESWLRMHVRAFEHFDGIPALAVPDNTKTGVAIDGYACASGA
jgi:transposase